MRRCFISNFFEGHVIEIGERIGEIDPGQMKGQVEDLNGQDLEIARGEILIEIEERYYFNFRDLKLIEILVDIEVTQPFKVKNAITFKRF